MTEEDPSRRRFLRGVLAAGASAATGAGAMKAVPSRPGEEALEEALSRFARTGPEYGGGLANHGPMAAEALVALGRAEAVAPWVERYRRGLDDHPSARDPISADAWAQALGRMDRVGDWIARFDRELSEQPWVQMLRTWVPRLAPGLVAAAAHGVIRTGHAVRGLGERDTAVRRHELAEGLAYWAARFQRLPDRPAAKSVPQLPSAALPGVVLLPQARRGPRGLISDGLAKLEGFEPFAAVAGQADTLGDASAFLSDLTATFARVYLEQAQDSGRVIAFIHAVTGPSAVRLLLPHFPAPDRPELLRYAWQAAAAMYAALGRPASVATAQPPARPVEALIDRAVATGDEHAIKFTEACLREHAASPRPIYLAAAWDAVERLGR
jgi:hypothetical protein